MIYAIFRKEYNLDVPLFLVQNQDWEDFTNGFKSNIEIDIHKNLETALPSKGVHAIIILIHA